MTEERRIFEQSESETNGERRTVEGSQESIAQFDLRKAGAAKGKKWSEITKQSVRAAEQRDGAAEWTQLRKISWVSVEEPKMKEVLRV